MTLILPRRSLLSYPAGTAPGFDPGHPAAQRLAMSGVSDGANFIDLVHGTLPAFGAGSTSLSPVMDGALGPASRWSTNNDKAVKLPGTVDLPTSITLGAIVRRIGTNPNGYNSIITNAAGYLFFITDKPGPVFQPNVYTAGDNLATNISLTNTTPYFIAYSGSLVNGGIGYFAVTNLTTGQIQTQTITVGSTFTNGTLSTFYIGNDNLQDNNFGNVNLAAVMASPNLALSLPQMQAWSTDPWSFWYPPAPPAQRQVSYSYSYGPTTPSTTTGGARVLQRFNRSKLAYPAGSLPGFDRSHPAAFTAAGDAMVSAVSIGGGNFLNLRNGTKGTVSGTGLTAGVDSIVGPVGVFANNTNLVTFPIPSVTPLSHTMAVIFRTGSAFTGINQYVVTSFDTGANGAALTFDSGTLNYIDAASAILALTTVTLNTTYFVAVSGLDNSSLNWVVANLTTGNVLSGRAVQGPSVLAENAVLGIGNRNNGSDRPSASSIAAAMYASSPASRQLSVRQLQQWSLDPWSFWYPNNTLELVSDGGTPTPPPVTTAIYYLMNVG